MYFGFPRLPRGSPSEVLSGLFVACVQPPLPSKKSRGGAAVHRLVFLLYFYRFGWCPPVVHSDVKDHFV